MKFGTKYIFFLAGKKVKYFRKAEKNKILYKVFFSLRVKNIKYFRKTDKNEIW